MFPFTSNKQFLFHTGSTVIVYIIKIRKHNDNLAVYSMNIPNITVSHKIHIAIL
jgi:hypothetical protein